MCGMGCGNPGLLEFTVRLDRCIQIVKYSVLLADNGMDFGMEHTLEQVFYAAILDCNWMLDWWRVGADVVGVG